MSLKFLCKVQLGDQMGICLFNNGETTIRSLLPTYDDIHYNMAICTNMPFYGDYTIDPGRYHIIIVELPKVKEPIIAYLRYVDKEHRKIEFAIEPSSDKSDIDLLKKMLLEKFQKYINEENAIREQKISNAIEKFQTLN